MTETPSAWQLGGLSPRELARRVWREMSEDEVTDRAAALAYYFIFALFPTLLFLTALLGIVAMPDLMDRLIVYVDQAMPADAASIVSRTLAEIRTRASGGLLSLGALAALWAASSGMASVMTTLNVAYDIEDHRSWWKRRLLSVLLTVGFAAFILTALLLVVFGPPIGEALAGRLGLGTLFGMAWRVLSVPVVMVFALIGIALVYYFAPAATQRWRWVTPGSLVALALWLAMSLGLRFYVTRFADYGATYGSIGGVILLMLWLYLTGLALLIGAEINAEIEHAAATRGAVTAKARGEHAAPMDRVAAPPAVEDDVVVAGHAVEEWAPLALLGAGLATGWLLRRRPAAQVAATGSDLAGTALHVAGAIAAVQRFRRPRPGGEPRAAAIRRRAA